MLYLLLAIDMIAITKHLIDKIYTPNMQIYIWLL